MAPPSSAASSSSDGRSADARGRCRRSAGEPAARALPHRHARALFPDPLRRRPGFRLGQCGRAVDPARVRGRGRRHGHGVQRGLFRHFPRQRHLRHRRRPVRPQARRALGRAGLQPACASDAVRDLARSGRAVPVSDRARHRRRRAERDRAPLRDRAQALSRQRGDGLLRRLFARQRHDRTGRGLAHSGVRLVDRVRHRGHGRDRPVHRPDLPPARVDPVAGREAAGLAAPEDAGRAPGARADDHAGDALRAEAARARDQILARRFCSPASGAMRRP